MARILVVDDEQDLRDLARAVLTRGKDGTAVHEVATAGDPVQALEILAEDPDFDVMLLDVAMPRMTGVEMLHRIRSNPDTRHMHVIMCTATSGDAAMERSFQAGADEYLIKPYKIKDLRARILAYVAKQEVTANAGTATG